MNLQRPTLIPGLSRVWRGPQTLQLGLDPALAVLIDLPDARAARMLDLLDGSRSERAVVLDASNDGVAVGDARDLLITLHAAGLVRSAPTLLPPALTDATGRRLSSEAAALALEHAATRRRTAHPSALPFTHVFSASAAALGRDDRPRPGREGAEPSDGAARPGDEPASSDEQSARPSSRAQARDSRPQDGGGPLMADDGPTPAQILRRRAAAQVVVAGRGRLGAGIAVALAEAGVGHVHPDLTGAVTLTELAGGPLRAAEAGAPRAQAVGAAIVRAAPETKTHQVRRKAATLIIQLGYDQPVALLAARHLRRRQPHLAVTIREGAAIVGPFVPATGAPCMNCLDLHRRDRDADWPSLVISPAMPEPCGVATILAATAFATAEALAVIDGRLPETLGAAVEIAAPGRFRRRTWPPHPSCSCTRQS